jgi:hypothetical protein
MKPISHIQCILLIAMLLVSQLGSAYASMPAMQDCGMDMSMNAAETGSVHTMQMVNGSLYGVSAADTMDCCDFDTISTCCEAQCQCTSFISSVMLFNEKLISNANYQSDLVVLHRITHIPPPFLQQPKRPPIRNFS